jgi:hypothetical protein
LAIRFSFFGALHSKSKNRTQLLFSWVDKQEPAKIGRALKNRRYQPEKFLESVMTTPIAPFAALSASGLSYDRLVSIFKLVQERANNATASEILDFVQESLSHEKFSHMPAEQRARMQVSLRALQEYALDVWRASNPLSQSALLPTSPSGAYQAVTNHHSGSFSAVVHTPLGPLPVVATPAPINRGASGAYTPVGHSSGSFPAIQIPTSGSYPSVAAANSFSPMTKRSIGQRCKEALRSLFGKTPSTPQLPNLSMDVTNAMMSPGE